MDALKLKRTQLRTAFTKAVNHLQEIIENDPVDKNAVEAAFEMLDAKGVKLKKIDEATAPKSRTRDIVESFPVIPENNRKAFEYLRMRFGQEDVLIQVYVRELLKLVLQNTEVKKVNLSSLYDKIEAHALESLGVTKEKYAAILFPLVESCLPAEILRA
ncbi:integrase catalytic domain-containing protein [Trichonephila clavipes]|nr:integrase catalytic domain-containing protein [Trichonephila clavipes]